MTSYINGVQQVSIAFGATDTSKTATISSVGANAFLVWQGLAENNSTNTGNVVNTRVTLTNSTTVTATRNSQDGANTPTINATVIDPTSSLVSNVRFGTVSISSSSSGTTSIASVNTSRSAVFYLGESTASSSDSYNGSRCGVTLTNGTTVTAYAGISGTFVVSFVVVEFASSVLNQNPQQFSSSFSNSSSTNTQTITSVNVNNSFIAYGGQTFDSLGSSGGTTKQYYCYLSSSTNVDLTRSAATTDTRTPFYTVLEFASGVLNSNVQRGTISLSGTASQTATITSVTTNNTLLSFLGASTSGSLTPEKSTVVSALTNTTTITDTRGASSAASFLASWEIVEFATSSPPPSSFNDPIWFGMTF